MIQFLLNDKLINTDMPAGMVMVDFIRYQQHLTGTKIGCREGDCGACTILTGELQDEHISYKSVTSCLMPLANARGKHIVTIEGINKKDLNAVQQLMSDESATQCGFCTPGFVMSLAGLCLQHNANNRNEPCTTQKAVASIDGNICRCTGYKSIERAAGRVADLINENVNEDHITFLINKSVLPQYFAGIVHRLHAIQETPGTKDNTGINKESTVTSPGGLSFLSGGTDLYVQQPELLVHKTSNFMFDRSDLKGISIKDDTCCIGGAATVSDILYSAVIQRYFPEISKFIKLVSSTPIRNMATVAGNFINASPIGDLSIFFLALDARLLLSDEHSTRYLQLQDLYLGYKKLAKKPSEYVKQIEFPVPGKNTAFNFEKVSKRTHLDIASVNSALLITLKDNIVTTARLSAGGVGPVPLFLKETSDFLSGKELTVETVQRAIQEAQSEISPISDIRGTSTYKRLLLKQLIKAHFITLFPYLERKEFIYG